MFQQRIYQLDELEWKVFREDLSEKVVGKSLIPEELTEIRVVLAKVEPGGKFSPHKDPYRYVFYFMKGRGESWLEKQTYQIQPGTVVEVPAGVSHGYKNTGEESLVLLTVTFRVPSFAAKGITGIENHR